MTKDLKGVKKRGLWKSREEYLRKRKGPIQRPQIGPPPGMVEQEKGGHSGEARGQVIEDEEERKGALAIKISLKKVSHKKNPF